MSTAPSGTTTYSLMPPRKAARGHNAGAEKLQPRSTAAVFADPEKTASLVEKPVPQEPPKEEPPQYDDPSSYSFPLNYIYEFQDFANAHANMGMFFQLLVVGYLAEVMYLFRQETVRKHQWMIVFNVTGVLVGTVLSYRTLLKKHLEMPTRFPVPVLPEFNLIYAVFLPLCFSLLDDLPFFVVNLALNYFVVENLHPVAKAMSAAMFYEVYNENEALPTIKVVGLLIVYYSLSYAITQVNQGSNATETNLSEDVILQDDDINLALIHDKNKSGSGVTLTRTEVHLVAVFLVNLIFCFEGTSANALPVVIFQKMVASLIVSLMLVYPVFKGIQSSGYEWLSPLVVVAFAGAFYWLTDRQLQPVLKEDPVVWLWNYIHQSQLRYNVLVGWVSALAVLIPAVFLSANRLSLNTRRKVWHVVLLGSIAYPALIHEPAFTLLSLLGSGVLFVVLEVVRYNRLTPVGQLLYDQLVVFQDFKDLKGPLNLLYIFLVLGVTIPIAYDHLAEEGVTLRSFIGILALGVGDTFASVIGKRFGSIKWKHGTKSIQGTVAFVATTFAGFVLVDRYLLEQRVDNWENVFIMVLLGGVLEGVSTLNDNVLIPCVMLVALEAISGFFL